MKESKEKIDSKPTVVIIDDAGWAYEDFAEHLEKCGFNVEFPLEDEHLEEKTQSLEDFEESLHKIQKKDVFLVMADQFYNHEDHLKYIITREWIHDFLKEQNEALIVETSFVPRQHGVYSQKSKKIATGRFAESNHFLTSLSFNNKEIIKEVIINLCDDDYRLAQKLDPNNRPMPHELEMGAEKLFEKNRIETLFKLLIKGDEDLDTFKKRYWDLINNIDTSGDETKNDKLGQILHSSFMTIFYYNKYKNTDRCELILTRLSNLLGISDELTS